MDAQTIRLLPAGSGDLRWVEAFALVEYPLAYAHLWQDGGAAYVSEAFSAQALDAELRESGSRLDLVEFEGERVGFCRVVAGKTPPRNGRFERYHYLHRIYLARRTQGRGVGRRVIEAVIDDAAASGSDGIWLESMATSPARPVYERLGFAAIDETTLVHPQVRPEQAGMVTMERATRR